MRCFSGKHLGEKYKYESKKIAGKSKGQSKSWQQKLMKKKSTVISDCMVFDTTLDHNTEHK